MPLPPFPAPPFPRNPIVANDPNGTKLLEDAMIDRARVRHLQADILDVETLTVSGATVAVAGTSVANAAALGALDTALLPDGATISVITFLCPWILRRASVAAPDGVRFIAAQGGGNWCRLSAPASEWLARIAWVVDQAIGNDENTGAAPLTALASVEEVWRRTGGTPAANATITIVGTYVGDIAVQSGGTFTISGAPPTVLYSGTMTALQVFNVGIGDRQLVTDAALPVGWAASALFGKRIVLTAGVNAGAWAAVKQVGPAGPKQAEVGVFWNDVAFGAITPVVLDAFDVVDVAQITGTISVTGGCALTLRDLRLASPANFDLFVDGGSFVEAHGVESRGAASVLVQRGGLLSCFGCYFSDSLGHQASAGNGGALWLWACSFMGTEIAAHSGEWRVNANCDITAANALGHSVFVDDRAYGRIEAGAWLACFDCAGTQSVVQVQEASALVLSGEIWGANNGAGPTPYAYRLSGHGIISLSAVAMVNQLAGVYATNDTLIGTVAAAYAGLPAADAATGCRISLSA